MIRKLVVLCVQVAFVAGFIGGVHAEPVELRVATVAPSVSQNLLLLEQAAADINHQTAGRVVLKRYPGGQQGDERDVLRKIKLGQLEGAVLSATGLTMIDESFRVFSLPMFFRNAAEVDYVADKMWPYLQEKLEKKGFKLLGRSEAGWTHFLSKGKLESLSDLKNQKMCRIEGDPVVAAVFRKLALTAIPLTLSEIEPAMAGGRITACYGTPLEALAVQWVPNALYMTSMPFTYQIMATVVSTKNLKKFLVQDQKAFGEIDEAFQADLLKVIRTSYRESETALQRHWIAVVQTPPALEADLAGIAAEVHKEMAGRSYSQEDLDLAITYRDEFRAKHRGRHSADTLSIKDDQRPRP